jgi:hypothetical protein
VTENRAEVLQYLRNIAKSANQRELDQNITALKQSQLWKESVPLQKYFTEFWGLHLQVLSLIYLYYSSLLPYAYAAYHVL